MKRKLLLAGIRSNLQQSKEIVAILKRYTLFRFTNVYNFFLFLYFLPLYKGFVLSTRETVVSSNLTSIPEVCLVHITNFDPYISEDRERMNFFKEVFNGKL